MGSDDETGQQEQSEPHTQQQGFVAALFLGEDPIGHLWVEPQRRQSQQRLDNGDSDDDNGDGDSDDDIDAPEVSLGRDIRVDHQSEHSDRCRPLLVLHTVSIDDAPWVKLVNRRPAAIGHVSNCDSNHDRVNVSPIDDVNSDSDNDRLRQLHSSLKESKTAVVLLKDGVNELHLVPVDGNDDGNTVAFWGYRVPRNLYETNLAMLNARCLAMVFDLDETLILANSRRSFDLRIEALGTKIEWGQMDAGKVALLNAEMERYLADRQLLMEFADSDAVRLDDGRIISAQMELVPAALLGTQQPIQRPVIRIPERNLILTRIHPNVRDTSILVRLRPSWELLRDYLLAKGRRRFEVFICTMSEKDYALEMWRLLDPGARLIPATQLTERLLCVRAGSKKSLTNLFQNVCIHPKLAMVIDDRPDVWEDKDMPSVHVVPPFAPYFAPQAEENATIPVMCVARNVASVVRGNFFKDFDEALPQQLSEVKFDTDVSKLPSIRSVGSYISSQMLVNDTMSLRSSRENSPKSFADGMAGAEVESAVYPPLVPKPTQSHPASQNPPTDATAAPPGFDLGQDFRAYNQSLKPIETIQRPPPAGGGWLDEDDTNDSKEAGEIQDYTKPEEGAEDPSLVYLQEYVKRTNAKVEFKSIVNSKTTELQFTSLIYVDGIKAGTGVAASRKEAKMRAVEHALRYLEGPRNLRSNEKMQLDFNWIPGTAKQEDVGTSSRESDHRKSSNFNAILALKTMANSERMKVNYLERPTSRGLYNCEVEVDGHVMGKGSNSDWETAKHQAAEQALRELKPGSSNANEVHTANSSSSHKRSSPRNSYSSSSKRLKTGDAPSSRSSSYTVRGGGGRDSRRSYGGGRSYTSRR